MKKFALLLLLVTLGQWNIHAQGGTFFFQNISTFPILLDPDIGGQTYVIGSSNAAVYGAGPGQVNVDLYVALASAPSVFYLAGTTTNSGSTATLFLGTFHWGMGTPYPIPSTLDGGAFTQGTVIDYYFTAETDNGIYNGMSAVGNGYTLSPSFDVPTASFGTGAGQIQGFIIGVPEPSTLAIGGLGVLAALLYRRRK